jgi:hypothetical protein
VSAMKYHIIGFASAKFLQGKISRLFTTNIFTNSKLQEAVNILYLGDGG